jgi:hypothetical protein
MTTTFRGIESNSLNGILCKKEGGGAICQPSLQGREEAEEEEEEEEEEEDLISAAAGF